MYVPLIAFSSHVCTLASGVMGIHAFTFMAFHDTHVLLGISCPMQPPNVSQLPSMQSPAQLPTSQSTVICEVTCATSVALNIEYESYCARYYCFDQALHVSSRCF